MSWKWLAQDGYPRYVSYFSRRLFKTPMSLESFKYYINVVGDQVFSLYCCIRTTHKIARTPPHQDKDLGNKIESWKNTLVLKNDTSILETHCLWNCHQDIFFQDTRSRRAFKILEYIFKIPFQDTYVSWKISLVSWKLGR